MNKLWQKWINTTKNQKIQICLWISSLFILILFVLLAALLTKGTSAYANALASVGMIFGLTLAASLFTTAIMSYRNGTKGGK